MKTFNKLIAAFVLVSLGMLASGAAMAQHRGHGGARFGFYFGAPMYAPYYPSYYAPYYPPSYYYPPAPIVYTAPPVYVEQSPVQAAPAPAPAQPQAQAQPQGEWFYCAASKAYYPYVSECPAGWQRVPAQPASR
jgi:hypothetical protein